MSMTKPPLIYERKYPYLCVKFPRYFGNTYRRVVEHYFPGGKVYDGDSLCNLMHHVLMRKFGKPLYTATNSTVYYHMHKSADTIRAILYPQLLEGRRVTAPRLIRLIDAEIDKLVTTLDTLSSK